MPVRAAFVLVAALMLGSQAAQTLQVTPLPRDGEVLVSFQLDEALTDPIKDAIHSGLLVKFVYKVDLRRASGAWFDRTIDTHVVAATVKFDNLTRRYTVTRAIDGRIDWSDTTMQEDEAWRWLTNDFARMSLFRGVPLEANAEYYVRVRANASPRNSAFLWPWAADDAIGSAKFTFVK
ncbi:MAG TPA: DUF4390 domain-containing protein [Vicinamibacterales bacterium]|jgi:hypothetical protein